MTDSTICCERPTPLANETTCELSVDHLMNMVESAGSIYNDIKCPECGSKYFEVGLAVSTCVYYPTVHSYQHKFSFIRTKCEKVFTVTEDKLVADYDAYQKEVNRRNAIGKPYDLEPTTLTFKLFGAGLIQFNGVACTLLMNKYKILKLKDTESSLHPH